MSVQSSIPTFLAGTFAMSLLAFGVMLAVPATQSPEGLPGLPVWLVAVWSPTVVGLVMAAHRGELQMILRQMVAFRQAVAAWWVLLIPFTILAVVIWLVQRNPTWGELSPAVILLLVAFNLILGPLGEEVGWRGFLQPALEKNVHWVVAALLVAVIWAIWHLPLWWIDSPQREIPFWVFSVHVLAYSLLMASAGQLAPGTLVPAIVLHLMFNMASGVVLYLSVANTPEWFVWSAPLYMLAALVSVGVVMTR
jgi:membrane protease YdiL (CAAX protease family)